MIYNFFDPLSTSWAMDSSNALSFILLVLAHDGPSRHKTNLDARSGQGGTVHPKSFLGTALDMDGLVRNWS